MKRINRNPFFLGCCVALLLSLCSPTARAAGEGISINGITAYGEKLTLVGQGIDLSDRTWNITWYYGSGSTWTDLERYHDDTSLTIDEMAAIGYQIQVAAVSTGSGEKYTQTAGPVTKGFQPPPSYVRGRPPEGGQPGYLDNLDSTQSYSYSADEGKTWTEVTPGATQVKELTSGNYLIRVNETEWGFASEGYPVAIPGSYKDAVVAWFNGDELRDALLDTANGGNTSLDQVKSGLSLVSAVPGDIGAGTYTGTKLTWLLEPSSYDGVYIDMTSGAVTRPQDGTSVTLRLTARLSLDGAALSRTFDVTILPVEVLRADSIRIVSKASTGFQYDDETKLQVGDTLSLDLSKVDPSWVTAEDLSFGWYYKTNAAKSSKTSTETYTVSKVPTNSTDKKIYLELTAKDPQRLKVSSVVLETAGDVKSAGTYELPTSDPTRPDIPPEPVEPPTYDLKVPITVGETTRLDGKVSYSLVALDQNGGLGDGLAQGTLSGDGISVALPEGDSRLTVQAEGCLPWVVVFADVDPAVDGAFTGDIPIELIPGKMETEIDPYAITLADKAAFVPVYGRIVHTNAPKTRTADFNGNGQVDFFDLAVILENIGRATHGAPQDGSYSTWDVRVTPGTGSVELAQPVQDP